MAGFFGRIFGPRQAKNALTNANTQTLRNALKNYINAVNKLNVKNNAHIRGLLMAKKNGSNISYKNRLVNGISNIVVASRAAKLAVGAANAGMVPETAAANVVNNAANQVRRNQAGFNALPGNNAAAPVPKNKKNNVNLNASNMFKQANNKKN